jgi:twitching motility protein PilT
MTKQLSDVLVQQGIIDETILQDAMAVQAERGVSLGKALLELGAATERQIVEAVARQLDMRFADLAPERVDPRAVTMIPPALAGELEALPIALAQSNELVVAVADPHSTVALDRIGMMTGMVAVPALAVRAELLRAIARVEAAREAMLRAPAPGAGALGVGEPRLAYEEAERLDLDAVLKELIARGGSDLHLTVGLPPMIRVHGDVEPLEHYPKLTPNELQKSIYAILAQKHRERFENELELDLSYSVPGHSRFRVNVFRQRDAIGAVMRAIPFEIKSIEELGLPSQIINFAYLPRGFVLVTGPTGTGKSTTLASLLDIVNRERACHIMTVEDPIEFLHTHKNSIVNQREIGTDTHDFSNALKHVLRQDPDVILIGEMRDLETIQVALTAAETGHLVFGTLHTQDAPQTVDRVVDVFPPHQQEQVRVMLGGALQGVVSQQLLRTKDGKGRVAACEVMIATPAIRNLIREGKTHQMYSSIQAGKQHGMVTMDQSLADLVLKGRVTYEHALEKCHNVADFNRLSGRA